MRVLIYTDLQAKEGGERLFLDASVPLQRWRVARFFNETTAIREQYKCDAIWDLGDTTDDRNVLALPTIQTVTEGLSRLCANTWPGTNLKLIGNHEQHLKNTLVHAGPIFQRHFFVVDNRMVFDMGKFVIVAAAFPANDNELEEWLKVTLARLSRTDKKIVLLGHFQVKGARMPSGVSTSGISLEAIRLADVVFLGHVHTPQVLRDNAWYVGSPFQQDFGERNEPKRVAIFDTDTFAVTWHDLPNFPRYHVVDMTAFDRIRTLGEDRYQVVLRSPDETNRLYAHPLSGSVEAVYAYDAQTKAIEREAIGKLTDRATIVQDYVHERPLDGFTESELIAAGNGFMS